MKRISLFSSTIWRTPGRVEPRPHAVSPMVSATEEPSDDIALLKDIFLNALPQISYDPETLNALVVLPSTPSWLGGLNSVPLS